MGGCLDKPKPKKSKINSIATKGQQSTKIPSNRASITNQMNREIVIIKPKYKRIEMNELLAKYRIDNTLEMCSKFEGPKYISNLIDGASKVMRVVHLNQIDQKRLQVYKNLVKFEIYQYQDDQLLIIDQYCAGQDIYGIISEMKNENKLESANQLLKIIIEIYKIVEEFHKNKVWLGNLNFSSFRKVSAFSQEIRLVDFNLTGNITDFQKVGFAHKDSYEADYQFLGYLIQFFICEQPPIFIPHKIQYVEFESIPYSQLVIKLLKGQKCTLNEILAVKPQDIVLNFKVSYGYQFRRDVNKLLKMRKKRKAHNRRLYGIDVSEMINDHKFFEEGAYRMETQRIFSRIGQYIAQIRSTHQQSFLNYAGNNQNIRKLKEVFLLTAAEKKISELKECLSTIK